MKKNFGLQSNDLLMKFRNKIHDIVAQVRDKLNKDSKEQGLIKTENQN
jgi:hypothetical protein